MKQDQLDKWKAQYNHTPMPGALDETVKKAIAQGNRMRPHSRRWTRALTSAAAGVAACMLVLNLFPATAQALDDVPVVGPIVTVLTFGRFHEKDEDGQYEVNIEVPKIEGLTDEALQSGLNEKYLKEAQTLYSDFMKKVEMKNGEPAHAALDAGYSVQARNGNLITIMHYVDEIQASGMERQTFDTIDTEKQLLITLPSLFQDDSYVEIINQNILAQMREQMEKDEGTVYFIGDDGFTSIAGDQQFYINDDNKLVIAFDEYAVAPGSMGVVEFVIPTETLSAILVSNAYIK